MLYDKKWDEAALKAKQRSKAALKGWETRRAIEKAQLAELERMNRWLEKMRAIHREDCWCSPPGRGALLRG